MSCSTIEVPDRLRTNSPGYNGIWLGRIKVPESTQLSDSLWNSTATFKCDALNAMIELRIDNGVLNGIAELENQVEFTANVSKDGRFYADVPRESAFLVNGRERFGAKEFDVFSGRVDPLQRTVIGFYLSAAGDMSEGGCTCDIAYRLVKGS